MGTIERVKRITPIREIREIKGWTQQQVVEMVNRLRRLRGKETLSMQVGVYSKVENGIREPRASVIKDLAEVFQVSMESLLADVDNEVETP